MKALMVVSSIVALVISIGAPAVAGSQPDRSAFPDLTGEPTNSGPFQAVPVNGAVLIYDTRDGHLWSWWVKDSDRAYLVYQGRLKPGKKIGELLGKVPLYGELVKGELERFHLPGSRK